MAFPASICPRSANVWDAIGFSTCFGDMVFGFGGNILALLLMAVLIFWCANPKGNQVARTCILHKQKWSLLGLCSLEIFLSLSCMLFLLKQNAEGQAVMYCQWLYNCSQTISWIAIALILNSGLSNVLCNRMLCFWCIVKPVMELPQFYAAICSSEVLHALEDGCSILAAIIFGIILSITTIGNRRRNAGLLGEALISSDDLEENIKIDGDVKGLSYWHLLTFRFVNPMIQCGSTKQLEFGNLLQLPIEMNPFICQDVLWQSWICEQRKHFAHASLFRAICLSYGWLYLKIGVLKVLNDSVGFLGPLLLNKLIWYLQEGSNKLDGFAYASLLGLSFVSKSFLDTQYSFQLAKLRLRLRASIMTIVYRKCLTMTVNERSNFSEGEIQTLMSIDADRTVNLCNSFHELWSLPVQIGVALFLLYTQVKVAFVSGIAITILLIPVNRWISGLIANATEKMMKQKDERIRRAGELLTHIRTLKMYSWELLFTDRLMEVRELEVKHLSTRKYLDAWCVFFWATTPTLFSLFTFGLFTLLGHPLNAATVFTCVALFNILISPLNSFPWVINGIIDAVISTRRLTRLLCCTSAMHQQTIQSFGHFERAVRSCTYPHGNQQNNIHDIMAVVINDANCVWTNKKSTNKAIVLKHINLEIPCGFLVAIVGEVGSGKSSLLNAILGEMQLLHGSVCTHGTIAYASQVPWILSGTIQDNILFGKQYIAQRYNDVVCACTLDFDIRLMVGGDHAHVGEKGVKLSGGQRARLALARAIYHGGDIYLLDDVLSAVDAQVASWIIQNAILGPLMNQKTRILCTHNPQIISSADMVIVMDGGRVKWSGSSPEFNLSSFATHCTNSNMLSPQSINQKTSTGAAESTKQLLGLEITAESLEDVNETVGEEVRKVGKVEFSVYKSYAKFASLPVALVICLSAFLMQASRNGNDFWLTHWVDTYSWSHHSNPSVHFYLSVLCIFAAVSSLLTLVRAFSFSYGGLRATVQVHNKLLKKLIHAPICFFEQNPTGRIINRFSSDQYAIDDSLPFILNILLANFFSLLGVAIVLSYVQIFFIFLLLPFFCIYSKLQFYYRCTSRELRRLDSVSRSPIYASFTETLEGTHTIRAFLAEERFMAQFSELIMLYQKTSYSEVAASLWLSLRLQLLAAFVISFIAIMAVIGHCGRLPFDLGTPGLFYRNGEGNGFC
ncbi:ABC transporter C family member 13 isoform X2 [Nymphaea colorata]|uniref:ABC transporter C family member 13 isoform X2 n=1 Tax=Nymphaea colorata TaxID=210225 RepID=UPI00129D9CB6|nr:ABC transporter C family member 13 isoform X2 [Nymphaea colorata]